MKTKTRFLGFLLMLSAFIALGSMSASADDFRSKATGNWNALATWEYSTDAGLNWNPAVSLPTLTDDVTIRNGYTVTGNVAINVNNLTIDAGGTLNANSTVTVVTLLTVSGTMSAANTVTAPTITVAAGGTMTTSSTLTSTTTIGVNGTLTLGGNVSAVEITVGAAGILKPDAGNRTITLNGGNLTVASGGLVRYNNTDGGTGRLSWVIDGATTITNGAASLVSTAINFYNVTVSFTGDVDIANNTAIIIYGDLVVTGGTFDAGTNTTRITFNNQNTGGSKSLTNTSGVVSLNQFVLTTGSSLTSAGISPLTFTGDFTINSSATYTLNQPQIVVFDPNAAQDITCDGVLALTKTGFLAAEIQIDNNGTTTTINSNLTSINGVFTVKGGATPSTIRFANNVYISGSGDFELESGATMILNNNTGVYGGVYETIKVTGDRTFGSTANYTFLGGKTGFTNAVKSSGTESNLTAINDLTIGLDLDADVTVTTNETFTVAGNLVTTADAQGAVSFVASTPSVITMSGTTKSLNPGTAESITLYDLVLTGTVSTAGAGTINITHNLSTSGTGTFTIANTHTVSMTGSAGTITDRNPATPTIVEEGTLNFSGTITLGSNILANNATGAIIVTSTGTLVCGTNTLTVNGGADFSTVTGATISTANSGGLAATILSLAAGSGRTYGNLINIIYANTAAGVMGLQDAAGPSGTTTDLGDAATEIGKLTFNGPGSITGWQTGLGSMDFSIIVNGAFTVASGATVDLAAPAASEAIIFKNGASIVANGTLAFYNIQIGNATDNDIVTTASSFTVKGNFNIDGTDNDVFTATAGTITLTGIIVGGNTMNGVNGTNGTLTFYNLAVNNTTDIVGNNQNLVINITNNFSKAGAGNFTLDALNVLTMSGTNATLTKAGAGTVSVGELNITGTVTATSATADLLTTLNATTNAINVGANASLTVTSGTVTIGAAEDIVVAGTGRLTFYNLAIAAATGTASDFTITNDFDGSGAALTASAGTITMTAADGNADIIGTGSTFYNLVVAPTAAADVFVPSASTFTIENAMSINANTTLQLDGAGAAPQILNSTASFTTAAGSWIAWDGNVPVVGAGGVIDVFTTANFNVGTNYMIYTNVATDAGLDQVDNNGDGTADGVVNDVIILSAGLQSLGTTAGAVEIRGDLYVGDGLLALSYVDASGGCLVTFSGSGKEIVVMPNATLEFDEIAITGTITTTSDFVINDNSGNGALIDVSATGSFTASSPSLIQIDLDGNINVSAGGSLTFYDLEMTATSGSTTSTGDFKISGDLTIDAAADFTADATGTIEFSGENKVIDIGASTCLILGNTLFSGKYTQTGGDFVIEVNGAEFEVTGSFIPGTGTIDFTNAAPVIINSGTLTFNNLGIDYPTAGGGVHATTESNFSVAGIFRVGSATSSFEANDGTITLSGNGIVTPAANYSAGTAGIAFNNLNVTGTYTYAGDHNIAHYGNLTVSGSYTPAVVTNGCATFYTTGNKVIDATGGTLEFVNFAIDALGGNNVITATDFKVYENFTVGAGATFVASAGTVTFAADPTLGADQTFTNNGSNAAALTFYSLAHNSTHDLFLIDGATVSQLYIKGNLINSNSGDINFETVATNSKVTFNGISEQTITIDSSGAVLFDNADLNNSTGIKLSGNMTDDELVFYETLRLLDGDIDLNGDNVLTINYNSGTGKLLESTGNVIKNNGVSSSTGNVYILYPDAAPALSNKNVGGLGMQISTAIDPGATTIRRYHIPQPLGGAASGYQTISRYYLIDPTITSGLNAQLIMRYDDTELNGNIKANLTYVTTNDPHVTPEYWNVQSNVTADPNNNLLLKTRIDNFEGAKAYWSAGAAPTLTLKGLTKGIVSGGVLTAGRTNQGIFGVKLTATGTIEVSKLKFNFYNGSSVARNLSNPTEFTKFMLVRSVDDDLSTTNDNDSLRLASAGGSNGDDYIEFDLSGALLQTITTTAPIHYFLVVDVRDHSSITSALTALQVYMNEDDVTLTGGLMYADEITGSTYTFQPGIYFEEVKDGLDFSPLTASSTYRGVFGFSAYGTTNTTLRRVTLSFNEDVSEKIDTNSLKVYRSTNNRMFEYGTDVLVTKEVRWNSTHDTAIVYFGSYGTPVDENLTTSKKYYFFTVDVLPKVNGATNPMTIFMDNSLTYSAAAGYTTEEDVLEGSTYEFIDHRVTLSDDNKPAAKNIGRSIVNQPIFGFTLTPKTATDVTFTSLVVKVTFGNSALNSHFTSFKLWYDANGDGYPQNTEFNWNGTYSGTSTSGKITFANVTNQTFSAARKYIITCNVLSAAVVNGTVQVELQDQSFVTLNSPAIVENVGPLTGNIQTVKEPGSYSKLVIVGLSSTSVTTGGTIDVAVQRQDANGTPVNATALTTLTPNNATNCSLGSETGTISIGSDFGTISGLTLTNATGTTSATFKVTDGTNTSDASEAITIYATAPTQAVITTIATTTTTTSMSVDSWTQSSPGSGRIFVIREGFMPQAPTNGVEYNSNTNLANIDYTGQTGPGSYVVFTETGAASPATNAFIINNLTPGKRYYIAVFEFTGSGTLRVYNKTMNAAEISTGGTLTTNVRFASTTSAVGDPYGTHDSFGAAAFIFTDSDIYSALATTEIATNGSYFMFNVESTRNNLLIRLSNLPANYTLQLWDNNTPNRMIREAANLGTTDDVIIINNAPAGKYFLKILGASAAEYSSSLFKLRVNTSKRANEYMSVTE